MTRELVVGLDLSLRRPAMCAIGSDWEQEWKRVVVESYEPSSTGAQRYWDIAQRVTDFCRRVEATHVYVEDYPRHIKSASVHALAECGGVVKTLLQQWTGLVAQPVNISSARKLLLGTLPRKDSKLVVFESLRSIDCPVFNHDEADAFVVANWGLSDRDWWFVGAGGNDA